MVQAPSISCPSTASMACDSALDRKPTLPQLMPRMGTSTAADALRCPQEGAVATQDDERVRGRQLADEPVEVTRRRSPRTSTSRTEHQPVARSRSSSACSLVGL